MLLVTVVIIRKLTILQCVSIMKFTYIFRLTLHSTDNQHTTCSLSWSYVAHQTTQTTLLVIALWFLMKLLSPLIIKVNFRMLGNSSRGLTYNVLWASYKKHGRQRFFKACMYYVLQVTISFTQAFL